MASATSQPYILAIDQGTSSSRAIIFDENSQMIASSSREIKLSYPANGWVEQDPIDVWQTTRDVCREVVTQIESVDLIAAIGITNQRETTIVWDRATGEPLYNAIVWQDRRTADQCASLKDAGHAPTIWSKTGLVVDPYFSGTKIQWILDHVPGARDRAAKGELAFGTIDSWLVWNLTGGHNHVTDATNASRTMLFNIETGQWDPELLALLDVPPEVLPIVQDSASSFGDTQAELLGRTIPILAIAGDQQAATVGQACFQEGMVKSTYGTGCFALLNTGRQRIQSSTQLLSTVAYRLDGVDTFALEGSIFMAGASVQWLRDQLKFFARSSETADLAAQASADSGVYLVPAFTGLGAPYWDAHARGAIYGLTRDSGIPELVAATLEAVCFQTRDLLDSMDVDAASAMGTLRVDGGMAENAWFLQLLADTLGRRIERPDITETTALGAAYLAGLQAGHYGSLDEIERRWRCAQAFEPRVSEDKREERYAGWKDAVARTLSVR